MREATLRATPQATDRVTASVSAFRDAMSNIAQTVHVVTTDGSGGRAGLTATAFSAVSDDPPTVLVCVKSTSWFIPICEINGVFGVSALTDDDAGTADVFAGRTGLFGPERFDIGHWTTGANGVQTLANANVALECRLIEARPVGTHRILLGAVTALSVRSPVRSLVYRNRGYCAV